jgi:hypothetical protein
MHDEPLLELPRNGEPEPLFRKLNFRRKRKCILQAMDPYGWKQVRNNIGRKR